MKNSHNKKMHRTAGDALFFFLSLGPPPLIFTLCKHEQNMSSKSILNISLDVEESFRDQEELNKLLISTGYRKGFAGWTYWAEIGSVYNIQQNYDQLISVLDNAADQFLPIRYKFAEVKLLDGSLSVNYFPEDNSILIEFREFMTRQGISFLDSHERAPFLSMSIENVNPQMASSVVESFVPTKTEIAFVTASIMSYKKIVRVFHKTAGTSDKLS